MNKNRNEQMDILRGIGIILIVLGHCGFPGTHFIYLFHLAIFVIISGYFFKEKNTIDLKSFKNFIFNKIKRLYVPYVVGNILCVILNNFFIDFNVYSINSHNYLNIKEMLFNIIEVIFFHNHTQLLGATWFLRLLFTITVGYAFVELIINKVANKYKNLIQLIISIILLLVGYYLSFNKIDLKIIDTQFFMCYILFDFGRKISSYKDYTKISTKVGIILISLIILYICNKIGSIEISQNEYTSILFFISVSILGWLLIYEISYFCMKLKYMKILLKYIGRKTMPILIFHFVAFKIINFILVLLMNENIKKISVFPVLYKGGCWWILYSIFGIILSLIFSIINESIKNKLKTVKEN